MMLPDKRKLRKCLDVYREPPKSVLLFFRENKEDVDYAAVGKTVSADGKCVYALLYYSKNRLERATFINRDFDSIDVVPHTPVKWYRRICFIQHEMKTVLLNAGPFYSYFRERNRNISPFRFLEHEISQKKEADSLKKFIENAERKNKAYNAEMRPVPRGFFKYAQDVQSYGWFDTANRHEGCCMECGKDFHTDAVMKYKHRQVCPHCSRALTMFTVLTRPRYSVEYGVHYIDRDVNNEAVVRHFLVTKHFMSKGCDVVYFEYERNRFKANDRGYSFFYQVSRWNNRSCQYLWRDSKPTQGCLWSMRNIFYEDEYLYTDNLKEVFADNPQYAETIKFLAENNKIRAEDYLHRMDVAYDAAREFIIKGYPELLYNYYPGELKNKTLEDCLSGISDEFREIIKETGYVSGYQLSKIREIQTFGFDLFKFFCEHAKKKGLYRMDFAISALRYGPHISEKLIKAGHIALWNTMDSDDLAEYDNYSIKELFRNLTPQYKQFIKRRANTNMQDIELLRRWCVKGVGIENFRETVERIRAILGYRPKINSVEMWSDFLDRCEKYNVSVHKALNYLEDNDYYCWNDMCKWYLQLYGKPKRNSLLVKSMMTMHDELFALIQEKKEKESQQKAAIINSLIGRICRFFTNHHLQKYELPNGLMAIVPQCKEDFARVGNEMHICVGGVSYSMRHAKKNSVIFFLCQNNAAEKDYCCCEARVSNGKVYLAQCRMAYNAKPEDSVLNAAKDYCKVLNKTIQFKNDALMLKAA